MSRRLAWIGAALLLPGCATVHTEVRTEPGPLLETKERTQVIPQAGLRATLSTRYPELTVHFERYDLCRTERVSRYAENRITEKTSPEAGPAFATGLPTLALGLGLFLARGLLSDAPDRGQMDSSGHYGASDRTIATTWSIALMAIGAPAVLTGVVGAARSGVSTETRTREEVEGQKDTPCHPSPASGAAQIVTATGIGSTVQAPEGTLTLTAQSVREHPVETFTLDGAPVTLDEVAEATLTAFQACAQLLPGPGTLGGSVESLQQLGTLAGQCDALPEKPAASLAQAVAEELKRREAEQPRLPTVTSFDEALAQFPPALTLEPGSPDLSALDQPERLVGQAVLLRGLVGRRVSPNIVVVRVGAREVLVLLQPQALWSQPFAAGTRVEAVAVVAGTQALGSLEAPLLRAEWMRPAFVRMPEPAVPAEEGQPPSP